MAGEVRNNEELVERAAQLCFDFHAQQGGNLTSFTRTVASLQANWESRAPRAVFDEAAGELQRHADKQQAAIERMHDLLGIQRSNIRDTTESQAREVGSLEGEIASLRVGLGG